MRWFLPKKTDFLRLFDSASANIVRGTQLFRDILDDPTDLKAKVEQLKEVEHEGDRITHEALAKLNATFITPFDREDIHSLASRLDDILDATDAAAQRLLLYKIEAIPPYLKALARLLVASTQEVHKAVVVLHDGKRYHEAMTACVEINRLENEADVLHREALGDLFANATDAIEVIKLKDLYAFLEDATDRCEDAANSIETIILKSS
jgi:predicted phosphate transport protein (TIGR00153 family)